METNKKIIKSIRIINAVSLICFLITAIRYMVMDKDTNLMLVFVILTITLAVIEIIIVSIQHKVIRVSKRRHAEYISAWMKKQTKQSTYLVLKPVLHEFAKKHRLPVVNITSILDAIIGDEIVMNYYVEGKYTWYRKNVCFEIKVIKMTSTKVFLIYKSHGYDHTDIFNR